MRINSLNDWPHVGLVVWAFHDKKRKNNLLGDSNPDRWIDWLFQFEQVNRFKARLFCLTGLRWFSHLSARVVCRPFVYEKRLYAKWCFAFFVSVFTLAFAFALVAYSCWPSKQNKSVGQSKGATVSLLFIWLPLCHFTSHNLATKEISRLRRVTCTSDTYVSKYMLRVCKRFMRSVKKNLMKMLCTIVGGGEGEGRLERATNRRPTGR